MTTEPPLNDSNSSREDRFVSHALVEVRKYKLLPFFCDSAVLLDISLAGFKLEFTSEVVAKPGCQYWLTIPLSPLGIYSPSKLTCRAEVRWFDEQRHRIGGVFIDLSKSERMIIEQVITSLKAKGAL